MLIRHRDVEGLRQAMLAWLPGAGLGGDEIDLPRPVAPSSGGSSELFFLSPMVRTGGEWRRRHWVIRIEATADRIYETPSIEREYRVMERLGELGAAPVPRLVRLETDGSVLGAPFYIMERVEGVVPDGAYHSRGAVAEAPPAERERMWCAALEALAAIHRTDPGDFAFLGDPAVGAGLDREIAVWDRYADWCGLPPDPVQERARLWLDDHKPADRPTGLAWGDARIANMVFAGTDCRAVIDWETVSLGGAETDLGWWLFFDWYMSDGIGVPRLEGLPGREDTLAIWRQASGREAADLDWHEVFATWRFSMISAHARALATSRAEACPGPHRHPSLRRLGELIGH